MADENQNQQQNQQKQKGGGGNAREGISINQSWTAGTPGSISSALLV